MATISKLPISPIFPSLERTSIVPKRAVTSRSNIGIVALSEGEVAEFRNRIATQKIKQAAKSLGNIIRNAGINIKK